MARNNRQVAFLFDEAGDLTVERIGGKAFGLATMAGMGIPVPPGFAVSTGVCRAYLQHGGQYPRRFEWHVQRCLSALEQQTGKRFGDPLNPLLVSVRSGAPVSMPGMMDTILNLGINQEAIPALQKIGGLEFAQDTYDRFQASFGKVVGSKIEDPREQLRLAFEAVCLSWLSDRAVEYRRVHKIPETLGTAVIVQAMTFGNLDEQSGTGVFFSRDVATGENRHYGEFLPCAQGEDVVGGSVTPLPIAIFAERHPEAFKQLTDYASILEKRVGDVVELEFTLEQGKLWILQYRKAKRTSVAAARFAVQFNWEKRISKAEAVARLSDSEVRSIRQPEFDAESVARAEEGARIFLKGLAASPGAVIGTVVFSSEAAIRLAKEGGKPVLFRPETTPDDFTGMLAASAIVTSNGGVTSHAAVVARELSKPVVVGVGPFPKDLSYGDGIAVDGTRGVVSSASLKFKTGSNHKEVSLFLKWLGQSRPQLLNRADFSAVNRQMSANVILNDFYLVDAMAKTAQGTELEREAGELRERIHRETAEIFAAYLMLAVAGELRHGWLSEENRWKSDEFKRLQEKFGLLPLAIDISRRFDAQMSVVEKLRDLDINAQKDFLELAVRAFNTWSAGSSIGGWRWAEIARTVLGYLNGDYGNTLFVDRVFDLRHNGGVLFNKHPMFSALTTESNYYPGLKWQLDVKQKVSTINQLFDNLVVKLRASGGFDPLGLSQPVANLWQRGKGKFWGLGS